MAPYRFVIDPQGAALAGDRWDGTGPPVVFLHAGVTDRRAWEATIDALGGEVAATTYDRRGFGESPPSRSPFSHLDDLVSVLEAREGSGPVWLVGSSAGGAIALEAALTAPDRVAGLVLLAPAVSGAPPGPVDPDVTRLESAIEVAVQRGDTDEVNRLELWLWLDGAKQTEGRVQGDARRLVAEMNHLALMNESAGVEPAASDPVWPRLGEIGQPALVLCGVLDLPSLRERSRNLAAAMGVATYAEIDGVAHLPQVEQPDEVARLIAEVVR